MINSLTARLKKKRAQNQSHQWVVFSNPRNGLVKISACKNCGTGYAPVMDSRACQPVVGKTSIESRGWIIAKQTVLLTSDTSQFVA